MCMKSGYDHITYTSNETFEINDLSNEFYDCLSFIKKYKSNLFDKYIKCKIVKNVTCGQQIVLHTDSNDAECEWKLNETTSTFSIRIQSKNDVFTNSHRIPQNTFEESDLIGYLECKIKDERSYDDFKIEEPFVLRKNDVLVSMAQASGSSPMTIALICVCIGGAVISIFIYLRNRNVVSKILKTK